MKPLVVALCVSLGVSAAEAKPGKCQSLFNSKCVDVYGAPAPHIGSGIPAAMVIGGVLLGATLLMRSRGS